MRRVAVRGDKDKSRQETTERRITVENIAYRNYPRLEKWRRGIF